MLNILNNTIAAILDLSRWTPFDVLIKATLFLMLGLAARQLTRGRAASLRHLLLAATFGALLILPIVVIFAPRIHVRVPTFAAGVATPQAASPLNVLKPTQVSIATTSQPVPGLPARPSWRTFVAATWGIGVVLLLTALVFDLLRLVRLRRYGIPSPDLDARVQALAMKTGIHTRVELLLLSDIPGPVTFGFVRPVILLPDDARSWADEEIRRALIHELEHVRRADWAVQLLARIGCSFYWFHPFVWSAWRKLCLEAERTCDDAVLRREEAAAYAEQLVCLARRMTKAADVPALGMARRSDLSERVRAVLDARQRRDRVGFAAFAVTLSFVCILSLTIGPIRAIAQSGSNNSHSSSGLDKALFEAAERGDNTAVDQLIASGANVNATISGDGSPLIAAARKGYDETISLLLDRGADPNMGVQGDGSPLIASSEHSHITSVRLLLDRGADIRKPVLGDGNPLIMAARGGSVEVVELLLSRGADIEQIVPGDENALTEASASGRLPVVKLLVSHGANVNARIWAESAAEWRTPLKMALRNKHTAVAEYLRSTGARE